MCSVYHAAMTTRNRPRKTVDTEPVVDALNQAIVLQAGNRDKQQALCSAIEIVLFQANSYAGFQHVDRDGNWDRIGPFDVDGPDYYSRHYYGGKYNIQHVAAWAKRWKARDYVKIEEVVPVFV
jgi:hypothetical protein